MSRRPRRVPQPAPKPARPNVVLPAGFLIVAALASYAAVAYNAVINGRLGADEVVYLIKGWWYITGSLMPFSTADASPTMPTYPFALGALQNAIGLSLFNARVAMAGLGALNGLLLFLLCRKLTANTLASAGALLVFLGAPATSYSFTTVTPVAFVSTLQLAAAWLLLLGLGRPKIWLTLAMGLVLGVLPLTSSDMTIPALLMAVLFVLATRSAWIKYGLPVFVVMAGVIAAALYVLPEQFSTFLLDQHLPQLLLHFAGVMPSLMTDTQTYDVARIAGDVIEGVLFPYGGTIIMCIVLFGQTLSGPRVLWAIPFYFVLALAAVTVFRAADCEACVAMAPSQVSAVGALGAGLALAFLARWRRQNQGSGTAFMVGGAVFALAVNTFAPGLSLRENLHYFPAEMLKQSRPAAEQQDIAALMRVVAENIPGSERVLLLHKVPALPYAVHMAGRRFPAVSLNPLETLRIVPTSMGASQREAMLAAIDRSGGWTAETLRRWIDRDYDAIVMQEGILNLDQTTVEMLDANFEIAASPDYRGAKLIFYKRKG